MTLNTNCCLHNCHFFVIVLLTKIPAITLFPSTSSTTPAAASNSSRNSPPPSECHRSIAPTHSRTTPPCHHSHLPPPQPPMNPQLPPMHHQHRHQAVAALRAICATITATSGTSPTPPTGVSTAGSTFTLHSHADPPSPTFRSKRGSHSPPTY